MLEKIIDRLKKKSAPQAAAPAVDVKRLAAAALMVEAARRDLDFAETERSAITRIVGEHFHLDADEAKTLVDLAEKRQRLPYGETIFTRTVRESFTADERKDVVEMMWEVAFADGTLTGTESSMIHRLSSEIGVDRATCDEARRSAEAKSRH